MKSWLMLVLAALAMTGCCGTNRYSPFAPYGSQCIAPPPTGTIGYNQGYYQQPAMATVPAGQSLQPVPSLSNQPAEPRTSSLPNNDSDWESAERPALDFGASRAPVQPRRAMSSNVRPSNNLAWIPPLQSGGIRQVSAQQPGAIYVPAPADRIPVLPAPSYVAPVAALGPVYNPVRPSVVRPSMPTAVPQIATADCNCDARLATSGVPVPDPRYSGGPIYQAEPIYTAVDDDDWRARR